MPHKLPFRVVQFSSEDNVMHARDLLQQGPGIRGWSSARYSTFPQEIVFQMEERSHLTKIQLLAHQCLIPETIDIFIGESPPGKVQNFYNAKFAHLGYVNLSNNEHSEFKARELKTVNVDCTGTFLKLVLQKNYLNKLNVYNQVAIVALNIFGNEVEDNNNSVSPDGEGGKVPSKRDSKGDKPLNQDLAFTMYVDTHVAEVIAQMEMKREKARLEKRQEYSKKLQDTIDQLRVAGEKIGRLEIEKRQAIDNENFDRAKLKKKQIEEYRETIYQHYNVDELLEVKGRAVANDKGGKVKDLPSPLSSKKSPGNPESTSKTPVFHDYKRSSAFSPSTPKDVSPTPKPLASQPSKNLPPARPAHTPPKPPPTPPKSPSPPPIKTPSTPLPGLGSQRRPLTPSSVPKPRSHKTFVPTPTNHKAPSSLVSPPTAYTDYDERTLPALKHRSSKESPEESCSLAGGLRRTSLTETEKKDAALPLQIFDHFLVEKFYSKNYSEKEKGLQLLQDEMASYSYEATGVRPDRYTKALVTLIRKALKDKVYSVCQKASQALSELLKNFINTHRVSKKEIGVTLERILPDLITKTADNAQRIQNLAVAAILEMLSVSLEKGIGGVGLELTRPLTQVIHPRSALCRANIVETQLEKMKTSSLPKDKETGFTVKVLVEFGLSALQHQNSDVRKCGERLLINLYHHYPVAVRRVLPMEDEPARRNVLFRNLFEQLEELDRKRQNSSKNKSGPTTPQQHGTQAHFHDFHQASASHAGQPFSYTSTPGGSSTSSGFSTSSSTAGDRHGSTVPTICITPDEAEARGRTLSRLNSSRLDLREEDEDELMSPGEIEEKTCIFCGQFDETFSGSGLDLHYWKGCPLLTRCTFCKQVIEIASLSDHLLEDCESSKDFKKCERCTEAIPKFEIHRHVLASKCNVAKPTPLANHCPLCHENIPPWDGGWRKHLMPGLDSCPANPRTRPKFQGSKRFVNKSFDKDSKENSASEYAKGVRERRSYESHSDRWEPHQENRSYGKKYSSPPSSASLSKKEISNRKR